MNTSVISFLYWLMVGLIVYTYAGYPLWLWLRIKLGGLPAEMRQAVEPRVSILVIAHDEATRIERKIANLLALDYPKEKLEIVVASDASTDGTVELVERHLGPGIALRAFDQHRGKPAVLNALIPTLGGDIVVLMDARQTVEPQAMRELVAGFADPAVGAVSGELMLGDGRNGSAGVGFYWRYEKALRHFESRLDSTVGVTGAFYALRRHLFRPIPEDTLLDDVLIPMQVVRQGYRVRFEPLARAHDELVPSTQTEYRRKVRTLAGNYQLFFRHLWLLNPVVNRLWWQTVSHKLCRLLCPAALALALVLNLLLLDLLFYRTLLLAQLLFYLLALLAQASPRMARRSAVLSVPQAFCLLNWCAVVGGYRFLRGSQRVTWAKAPPEESSIPTR